jgi:hypothetical protein
MASHEDCNQTRSNDFAVHLYNLGVDTHTVERGLFLWGKTGGSPRVSMRISLISGNHSDDAENGQGGAGGYDCINSSIGTPATTLA